MLVNFRTHNSIELQKEKAFPLCHTHTSTTSFLTAPAPWNWRLEPLILIKHLVHMLYTIFLFNILMYASFVS